MQEQSQSGNSALNYLKQFCKTRLDAEPEMNELQSKINILDSQKRALKSNVFKSMKSNMWENIQIESSTSNEKLQVKLTNIHTYALPTHEMITNAPIDWNQLMKIIHLQNKPSELRDKTIDNTLNYMHKSIQVARRTTKKHVTVKVAGKRSTKKLMLIDSKNPQYQSFIKEVHSCHALNNATKQLRRKRKRLVNSKADDYQKTLQYLKSKDLTAQTFNLRTENGGQSRLLLRRVNTSSSLIKASVLKDIIKAFIEEIIAAKIQRIQDKNEMKNSFCKYLIQHILLHQKNNVATSERLIYEIQN